MTVTLTFKWPRVCFTITSFKPARCLVFYTFHLCVQLVRRDVECLLQKRTVLHFMSPNQKSMQVTRLWWCQNEVVFKINKSEQLQKNHKPHSAVLVPAVSVFLYHTALVWFQKQQNNFNYSDFCLVQKPVTHVTETLTLLNVKTDEMKAKWEEYYLFRLYTTASVCSPDMIECD